MSLLVTFSCGHLVSVRSFLVCGPGQEVLRCPHCPGRRGVSQVQIEKPASKMTRELTSEVKQLYDADIWLAGQNLSFWER